MKFICTYKKWADKGVEQFAMSWYVVNGKDADFPAMIWLKPDPYRENEDSKIAISCGDDEQTDMLRRAFETKVCGIDHVASSLETASKWVQGK